MNSLIRALAEGVIFNEELVEQLIGSSEKEEGLTEEYIEMCRYILYLNYLFKAGPNEVGTGGITNAMYAAYYGYLQLLEIYVDREPIDFSLVDIRGNNVFRYALFESRYSTVEFLLQHGANPFVDLSDLDPQIVDLIQSYQGSDRFPIARAA